MASAFSAAGRQGGGVLLEQLDAPEMNEIDPASVQRGIENVLASEQGGQSVVVHDQMDRS